MDILKKTLLKNSGILEKFKTINVLYSKCYSTADDRLQKRRSEMMAKGLPKVKPIDGVKNIILVTSGKGGVGKSTTAVNIAAALKIIHPEKNVGLLDADVFGPTIPLMMNLNEAPMLTQNNLMIPLVNYGIKCMSMGFLIEEGSPVVWRGLMVMQAMEKLMRRVQWDPVDYLIIDTPPGTGDTHLSLIQNIPVTGVILVTTPQTAALQVVKRGANMYKKLNIPLIGLVENMNIVKCPKCHSDVNLFGEGTAKLAGELNIEILASLPLNRLISSGGDKGVPIVISHPDDMESNLYKRVAENIIKFSVGK